jgi:hypothetical protein
MRTALVILLIHGLAPALGEVAETVVHYLAEGHLAHTVADHGVLGDQGDEHGCGTTQHHCDCCASQAVGAAAGGGRSVGPVPSGSLPAAPAALASLHEPAPPLRPPIRA